jgi:hypothetical protein
MGGAVAHLSALWMLTTHLRPAQSAAADEGPDLASLSLPCPAGAGRKPLIVSVGFGAPLSASSGVKDFVLENALSRHFLTIVNRGDCVPGAFLFAQSAETLVQTYSKASDSLASLKLLSEAIQQVRGMPSLKAFVCSSSSTVQS